jgi:hypothetical protein
LHDNVGKIAIPANDYPNPMSELHAVEIWNRHTGEKFWDNRPRPYALADVVCKDFGVATMEWLKRHCDFEGLKWRILPLTERAEDLAWINAQQLRYSGKFSACVFDIFD